MIEELKIVPFQELDCSVTRTRWMIEGMWMREAVGIVGGEPKCCKSFLALDMAVAVASGAPCLRRYEVKDQGPVLMFPAEDSHDAVAERINGICRAAKVDPAQLELFIIDIPVLRLDQAEHQEQIVEAVRRLRPRMLLLDPLVRMHSCAETQKGLSPILDFLRNLQREYGVSVVVVHHSKKQAGDARGGQALRGTGELHAWVDVTLFMRRAKGRALSLSIEHRAAASEDGIPLNLQKSSGGGLALAIDRKWSPAPQDGHGHQPAAVDVQAVEVVRKVLTVAPSPMRGDDVRRAAGIRASRCFAALRQLVNEGAAVHTGAGYRAS